MRAASTDILAPLRVEWSGHMEALLADPSDGAAVHAAMAKQALLGLYPIVTFQYSSTTLYQVSYHIQYLFF
jgi:hypothetical protein